MPKFDFKRRTNPSTLSERKVALKHRLKVMHWTSRGLWICPYRPEEGTLSWPKIAPDLDAAQFHALIDGLEFDHLPGWKPRKRPT
jgi:hypothetical protein